MISVIAEAPLLSTSLIFRSCASTASGRKPAQTPASAMNAAIVGATVGSECRGLNNHPYHFEVYDRVAALVIWDHNTDSSSSPYSTWLAAERFNSHQHFKGYEAVKGSNKDPYGLNLNLTPCSSSANKDP